MLTKHQREMIVRLKQDGKKQQQIALLIGCSQAAVSQWLSRQRSGRTLDTLPRSGRPTKLTKARLHKLRLKIVSEVRGANDDYCSLNTKQLGDIIKNEVGRMYSLRHVERIMHKLGFSLVKPRAQHIRHDRERVEQFREEFKKNLRKNTWVLSSSHSMR